MRIRSNSLTSTNWLGKKKLGAIWWGNFAIAAKSICVPQLDWWKGPELQFRGINWKMLDGSGRFVSLVVWGNSTPNIFLIFQLRSRAYRNSSKVSIILSQNDLSSCRLKVDEKPYRFHLTTIGEHSKRQEMCRGGRKFVNFLLGLEACCVVHITATVKRMNDMSVCELTLLRHLERNPIQDVTKRIQRLFIIFTVVPRIIEPWMKAFAIYVHNSTISAGPRRIVSVLRKDLFWFGLKRVQNGNCWVS